METEVAFSRSDIKLRQFFETESDTLLKTIRLYVYKAGYLAQSYNEVEEIASEILSQVFIEAIEQADRFDAERSPRAWLLGIAANLIKRRLDHHVRDAKREVTANGDDEEEFFDRIAALSNARFEDNVGLKDEVESLIVHLSAEDQAFVRVAMKHNLKGNAIAAELRLTPGNVRVKLYRVLQRLRTAAEQQKALNRIFDGTRDPQGGKR